jgi:peptidoglycan/LPS O-acetylase OafA/YrhL
MWRGLVGSQATGSKPLRDDPQRAHNPEAAKLEDFAAFDILRFALASTVLLSHLDVLRWAQAANLAVQVFFSLSGWLIGGILCRTQAAELGRFYFNRATRIWIPYFVTVMALYGISLIHEHRSTRWFEFLIYDVTFTHNWFSFRPTPELAIAQMPLGRTGNHFWSLAAEEQFYLIAPLIMIFLPYGKTALPWIGVAVLCYLSGSQYAAISFGVLAAVVASRWGDWQLKPAARVFLTLSLVVSIVLMYGGAGAYRFGAPLFSVSAVLLCATPIRRTAVSRWLGGVSFPLYLNAWIGLFAFHAFQKRMGILQGPWVTALELVFGLAAAALMYHAIDARVMARRHLWYTPRVGWSLGIAAYTLLVTGVIYGLLKHPRG